MRLGAQQIAGIKVGEDERVAVQPDPGQRHIPDHRQRPAPHVEAQHEADAQPVVDIEQGPGEAQRIDDQQSRQATGGERQGHDHPAAPRNSKKSQCGGQGQEPAKRLGQRQDEQGRQGGKRRQESSAPAVAEKEHSQRQGQQEAQSDADLTGMEERGAAGQAVVGQPRQQVQAWERFVELDARQQAHE